MTSSFVSIGYDPPHLFDLHASLFTDSNALALSLSRSIFTHKLSSPSSISVTFHLLPQTLFTFFHLFHVPSSPTNSLHFPPSLSRSILTPQTFFTFLHLCHVPSSLHNPFSLSSISLHPSSPTTPLHFPPSLSRSILTPQPFFTFLHLCHVPSSPTTPFHFPPSLSIHPHP